MTELYMIRHGLAGEHGSYANDDERPLTEEGQRKTRKVAKRLKDLDLHFDWLLTSPLVRAYQTAEILKDVGLSHDLEKSSYLAPGGDFQGWLHWLEQWQTSSAQSLALVGHEPDLSQWAEQLIWGKAPQRLILRKAGVIGLLLPEAGSPVGHSQLFWLTPPKFLL
jgi:phosphohistidine phosphatase